jgi:chaperonin GroES
MNLKPLQDWAVIRRSEAEEKTAGGIIIPDTAKEKPLEGVIVAIGPGRYKPEKGKEKEKKKKFVPTVLKPGQKVIYQKYAEREVELGNEVITLVREEDILGTVEDYAVADRKIHAIEKKKEGSVAIREKAHVPAVTPAKTSEKKSSAVEKKTPAKKPAAKETTSKEVTAKKPAKKTLKKTVVKKTQKKAAKKTAPAKKKVVPPAKKSLSVKRTAKKAKKTAAVKAVPKKTAKPAPKKTAVKKIAVKKTAKKTLAKTKGKKK